MFPWVVTTTVRLLEADRFTPTMIEQSDKTATLRIERDLLADVPELAPLPPSPIIKAGRSVHVQLRMEWDDSSHKVDMNLYYELPPRVVEKLDPEDLTYYLDDLYEYLTEHILEGEDAPVFSVHGTLSRRYEGMEVSDVWVHQIWVLETEDLAAESQSEGVLEELCQQIQSVFRVLEAGLREQSE